MQKQLHFFIITIISIFALNGCSSTISGNEQVKNTAPINQKKPEKAEVKTDKKEPVEKEPTSELVLVYDGRGGSKSAKPLSEDQEFVKTQVAKNETKIKKIVADADSEASTECAIKPEVNQVLKGSFSQPNSSQKLYKYELCVRIGASFQIAGIIITEGEKVLLHQIFEVEGSHLGVSVLPDINKNGLSEVVLALDTGGSGLQVTELHIQEFQSNDEMTSFGSTQAWSLGFNSTSSNESAFKISAQPGEKPVYFREEYTKKDDEKNWKLVQTSKKFLLDENDGKNFFKIYPLEK